MFENTAFKILLFHHLLQVHEKCPLMHILPLEPLIKNSEKNVCESY